MQAEVEAWNPLTDPVPIHSWIHPWLPLMGKIFFYLYESHMRNTWATHALIFLRVTSTIKQA